MDTSELHLPTRKKVLEKFRVNELKRMLSDRNLDADGKKKKLIDRLWKQTKEERGSPVRKSKKRSRTEEQEGMEKATTPDNIEKVSEEEPPKKKRRSESVDLATTDSANNAKPTVMVDDIKNMDVDDESNKNKKQTKDDEKIFSKTIIEASNVDEETQDIHIKDISDNDECEVKSTETHQKVGIQEEHQETNISEKTNITSEIVVNPLTESQQQQEKPQLSEKTVANNNNQLISDVETKSQVELNEISSESKLEETVTKTDTDIPENENTCDYSGVSVELTSSNKILCDTSPGFSECSSCLQSVFEPISSILDKSVNNEIVQDFFETNSSKTYATYSWRYTQTGKIEGVICASGAVIGTLNDNIDDNNENAHIIRQIQNTVQQKYSESN